MPSASPELRELRHRYNRLCARFADASDADPIVASETVQELQSLSDRIVAMEMRDETVVRQRQHADSARSHAFNKVNGKTVAPRTVARNAMSAAKPAPDLSPVNTTALQRMLCEEQDQDLLSRPAPAPTPAEAPDERTAPRSDVETAVAEKPAERPENAPAIDFDRFYLAIEAQEAQIAAVLRRCEDHQRQLEAMERRLVEHYPAKLLASELDALRASLDQQRQRVTALAIAIQRLLHWLAGERQRGRQ